MVNLKHLAVVATALFECSLGAPAERKAKAGDVIPDNFIITLKSSVKSADAAVHLKWVHVIHKLNKRGGHKGVQRRYDSKSGFQGYAGSFDAATIKAIKKCDDVATVEPDRLMKLAWWFFGPPKGNNDLNQTGAPWGLETISHRAPNSSGYLYDSSAGANTYAYIVDTGVRLTHHEFQGRAANGWTALSGQYGDGYGHGTHVAGIVAGKTYGVTKKAQIISVKITDQNAEFVLSDLMGGVTWAINDVLSNKRTRSAVINMSLGGPMVKALNKLINNAFQSGVLTVVAAGNEEEDCISSSPASATHAITVAAIDSNWNMASFSNWGSSVNVFAPGVKVLSADYRSDTGSRMLSGTSMSAPHVAGLVLYALSVEKIAPADVPSWIQRMATINHVNGNLHGSPNLIGNNGNTLQSW